MRRYRIYLDSAHMACKPNRVLTSKLYRYLVANGHELVTTIERADFVILNSCGFTCEAERNCASFFARALPRMKANATAVAFGCLNRINPDAYRNLHAPRVVLLNDGGELDRYFKTRVGYDEISAEFIDERILHQIGRPVYKRTGQVVRRLRCVITWVEYLRRKRICVGRLLEQIDERDKLFVQIGSGCVGNCTYCIISFCC